MPRFRVDLSTLAEVTTSVEVETDTAEAARATATQVAQEGNVVWEYHGAYDDKIMVIGVSEVRG